MTLLVLRHTGQMFYRLSLNLGSRDVFLNYIGTLRILGMEMILIKFSFRKIILCIEGELEGCLLI